MDLHKAYDEWLERMDKQQLKDTLAQNAAGRANAVASAQFYAAAMNAKVAYLNMAELLRNALGPEHAHIVKESPKFTMPIERYAEPRDPSRARAMWAAAKHYQQCPWRRFRSDQ